MSRALAKVFEYQKALPKEETIIVYLSYLELYNNSLYDLLDDHSKQKPLKLWEQPNTSGLKITGSNMLRTPVTSIDETQEYIRKGDLKRSTNATQCNEHSSRSHSILTLEFVVYDNTNAMDTFGGKLEGTSLPMGSSTSNASVPSVPPSSAVTEFTDSLPSVAPSRVLRSSKLNIVDLAGSERVKQSGVEGGVLEESKQINKALCVLGDVLNCLSKQHQQHRLTSQGSFM